MNSATAYAFEHAVNLSFSMKNRGYGTGRAIRYADYSLTTEDRILFAAVLAMAAVSFLTVLPAATGDVKTEQNNHQIWGVSYEQTR